MSNYHYYLLFYICHIHNYTGYNQQWNVFSAFNPSKWAANAAAPGEQLGVWCLAQGSHLSCGQFLPEQSKSNTLSIRLRLPPPGMCFSHREDPRRCLIRAVLSFLHQGLKHRLSTHSLFENPTPDCIGLDQEGGGPAGIFGRWIVPWVWAGWLQCNTETLARLCAQGSYHWDHICVFHGILTRAVFPLADHILPSLMMQPEPSQRLPCAIGPYGVTSHE